MTIAIISAITPPVAVATYPASALSGASWTSIAGIACLAMAGIGYCWQRTTVAERLLFLIAGVLFLGFGPTAQSLIAVAVLALALASHKFLPAIPILGKRF